MISSTLTGGYVFSNSVCGVGIGSFSSYSESSAILTVSGGTIDSDDKTPIGYVSVNQTNASCGVTITGGSFGFQLGDIGSSLETDTYKITFGLNDKIYYSVKEYGVSSPPKNPAYGELVWENNDANVTSISPPEVILLSDKQSELSGGGLPQAGDSVILYAEVWHPLMSEFTYQWYEVENGVNMVTGETNQILTVGSSGTYFVRITASNMTFDSLPFTVEYRTNAFVKVYYYVDNNKQVATDILSFEIGEKFRFFGINSRIRFLRGCLEVSLFRIRQMFSQGRTVLHPVFDLYVGSSTLCK